MTDPATEPNSPKSWLWIAVLALLALAAFFMFFNPDGDADENVADVTASASDEERLDTDLDVQQDLPPINGADMDGSADGETADMEEQAAE